MKMTTLQIKFDADKLTALNQYVKRKDLSIEDEMRDSLNKLYEKLVPAAVREYIEFSSQSAEPDARPKKTGQTTPTYTANPPVIGAASAGKNNHSPHNS